MLRSALKYLETSLSRHGKLGAALVKAAVGSAGIRAVHGILALLTSVALANALAPASFGVYSFVMALVSFLAIPSELGIPRLAIREIAVTRARKEWGYMRGFIVRSHQIIGALTVFLVLTGMLILTVWGERIDPTKRQCMWLGLVLVPLISLGALRGAMLRGLRKVVIGQIPEYIVRPLALLLLVLLLPLFLPRELSPVDVMVVQIIASTIAFVFGLSMFVRHRPAELVGADSRYRNSAWLASTVPFSLMSMLHLINGRTDVLMLGFFREDAEVGIYRVAAQFGVLVIFGLQVVNSIQGPHIAHLYAASDMRKLQTMITRSSQAILAVALPMVLVFVVLGRYIIRWTFGEEFDAAYAPMVILCIGQLVNASIGSVGPILNMTGNERDTTRSVFIGAVVNVLLNIFLTPRWGAIGAAVSTATTLIVWNVIMWRLVKLRTGLDASPLLRRSA